MLKKELNIILSAILFFTRIKFPFKVDYNQDNLKYITNYHPFVGIVVGCIAALILKFFLLLHFPQMVAVIFVLVLTLLLTGALHEDGIADACDGFGGGYTKDRILEIMQDSSIGTYGTLGLITFFFMKFSLLYSLPYEILPLVLIVMHCNSRWGILWITYNWEYSRKTGKSKSRNMVSKLSLGRMIWATIIAALPLFLFNSWIVFLLLPLVLCVNLLCGVFFASKINGYTGDCLGAAQQISAIVILLFFLVLFNTFNFSLFNIL